MTYKILALYQFQHQSLDEVRALKSHIEALLHKHDARGSLLLAVEGINGTIGYPSNHKHTVTDDAGADNDDQDDEIFSYLTSRYPNLRTRISYSSKHNVFRRLRVRIKSEIVTMGVLDLHLVSNTACDRCIDAIGEYVKPADWNALISHPETLVIDARNEYEVCIGSFRYAVSPHTHSFVEFPSWLLRQIEQQQQLLLHNSSTVLANNTEEDATTTASPKKKTNIAMYCTGGIRCEKATAYTHKVLRGMGIPISLYHLEGGILAYLDQVSEDESLFEGECYVFDDRIAVTHKLQPSQSYQACHACRHPLSYHDRNHPDYLPGRQCGFCSHDPLRQQRRHARYEMRHHQIQISERKGTLHLGADSVEASVMKLKQSFKRCSINQ